MTDDELRRRLGQQVYGTSVALGLLVEGLRGQVEPRTLTDDEHAMLNKTVDLIHRAGAALGNFAVWLREHEKGQD